jgi:hypothetical protein
MIPIASGVRIWIATGHTDIELEEKPTAPDTHLTEANQLRASKLPAEISGTVEWSTTAYTGSIIDRRLQRSKLSKHTTTKPQRVKQSQRILKTQWSYGEARAWFVVCIRSNDPKPAYHQSAREYGHLHW